MENKTYWQDDYIEFKENLYWCIDETGQDSFAFYKTIEEARKALTYYSNQLSGVQFNEDSQVT